MWIGMRCPRGWRGIGQRRGSLREGYAGAEAAVQLCLAVSDMLRSRFMIGHPRRLLGALLWITTLRALDGQSINCANEVSAESRSRTGPGGVSAVLKVHSG